MEEEKLMLGMLTVYRERGNYLRRLEQFEQALRAYDVAVEKFPEDVRLLVGRSQAASDAGRPEQAFQDATAALRLQPHSMNARNMQAQALFAQKEFEQAIVVQVSGYRFRKQAPSFNVGINVGRATLQDSVGKNAGRVMTDLCPIIKRNIKTSRDENEPETKTHHSSIPCFKDKEKITQSQIHKQQVLSRVLAYKYLGSMAYDKFFLEKLVQDRRLNGANAKGSAELKALAEEALGALTNRQALLRAQRPYQTIKYTEKTESKHQTAFKRQLMENERRINSRTAEHMTNLIKKALNNLDVAQVLTRAERMQIFLDGKTLHNFPEKTLYVDMLYRLVGKAFYMMHRLSYTLNETGNRSRIAFLMGLTRGRHRSHDSVRAKYPFKFTNINDQIEKVENSLDACENSMMRCYLMYELAGLLNKQKNFALSKFFAKRCQLEAHAAQSPVWWINACYALISGDMRQGNANDVRVAVEEAQRYTNSNAIVPDKEQTLAFLRKCLEVAMEPISQTYTELVKAREGEILRVMDEKTAKETRVLLKRMVTVPAGRRFRVLPGRPKPLSMECERRRWRQSGLSVVPGRERGLRRPPRSTLLGYQHFDY